MTTGGGGTCWIGTVRSDVSDSERNRLAKKLLMALRPTAVVSLHSHSSYDVSTDVSV